MINCYHCLKNMTITNNDNNYNNENKKLEHLEQDGFPA